MRFRRTTALAAVIALCLIPSPASAQAPTKEDVEHSRWRYSLMNWGHDPLKK